MPDTERYEALIIGSGEAGKLMAWTLAKAGHHTAVIERKLVGVSFPNIACLPSKNIIRSAKVASFAHRAQEFGLEIGSPTTNLAGVQRLLSIAKVVQRLRPLVRAGGRSTRDARRRVTQEFDELIRMLGFDETDD